MTAKDRTGGREKRRERVRKRGRDRAGGRRKRRERVCVCVTERERRGGGVKTIDLPMGNLNYNFIRLCVLILHFIPITFLLPLGIIHTYTQPLAYFLR